MSADPKDMRLLLCSTCAGDRAEDRRVIERALAEQDIFGQVEIAEIACMGGCESPMTLGLQGGDMRASYVFTGITPEQDADDIARTCRLYLDSPQGWIEDARPCGRLRHCLRARLPAMARPR